MSHHRIAHKARNAVDGGYTKKFVARNVEYRILLMQYCAQQFPGLIYDAIKPLCTILNAILQRVSGPSVAS